MAIKSIELRKQIDDVNKDIKRVNEALTSIQTRKSDIEGRIQKATAEEREAIDAEIESVTDEENDLQTEVKTLHETLDRLERELEEAEKEQPSNVENPQEREVVKMSEIITRDSLKYNQAFLRGVKTGNYDECRSLLSDQVSGGQIPVPTQLENEIQTCWNDNQVLSLVKKSNFKGNVKVGFELDATGATKHIEGTAAPAEETITIGVVEIKNANIKKWITVSDEALEGTTVDTIGYIYKEMAYQIILEAEREIIAAIMAAPTASTATATGQAKLTPSAYAADTIVKAVAQLCGDARNLHIIMTRATYAEFISIALNANYAIDVFDGLKDKIVFSDALTDNQVIVGDFSGVQANLPNGNSVSMIVDPYSLAEKDLIKIVGRLYCGFGLVAPKRFTRIVKGE